MTSTADSPATETEGFMQKVRKSVFFCSASSGESNVIKKLELDIDARKKQFGVDYLNLNAKEETTPEELQEMVKKAAEDLAKLYDDVKAEEAKIEESKKKNTKEKSDEKADDEAEEKEEGEDAKPETAPEGEKAEDADAAEPTEGEAK